MIKNNIMYDEKKDYVSMQQPYPLEIRPILISQYEYMIKLLHREGEAKYFEDANHNIDLTGCFSFSIHDEETVKKALLKNKNFAEDAKACGYTKEILDDNVVGFFSLIHIGIGQYMFCYFSIFPVFRGMGVAKKFLLNLEDYLCKYFKDAGWVVANCSAENEVAYNLYTSLGADVLNKAKNVFIPAKDIPFSLVKGDGGGVFDVTPLGDFSMQLFGASISYAPKHKGRRRG